MLTVVCWKWKPELGARHEAKRRGFSAEHVNKLMRMLERNLHIPYELACVTDDYAGLHSSIKRVNINKHFGKYAELGGCYRRLRSFEYVAALALFGTKFVSIDLDVVITGDITQLLNFQEDFRIWQDKHRRFTPYCGSLWGMKAGAREFVWEQFDKDPTGCIRRAHRYQGTDQAHISCCLYPREATWGKDDGVYNFNTQVRRSPARSYRRRDGIWHENDRNGGLPPGACMVFFNGKYDPSQKALYEHHSWIGDLWQ